MDSASRYALTICMCHVKGAFFHLVERVELEPHISTSGWQQLPMNELISEPENKVVT